MPSTLCMNVPLGTHRSMPLLWTRMISLSRGEGRGGLSNSASFPDRSSNRLLVKSLRPGMIFFLMATFELSINLPSVSHSHDLNRPRLIINLVDHTIIPDSDSPIFF